jgi:hypothetical protein
MVETRTVALARPETRSMKYGIPSRWDRTGTRGFNERAFRRASLPRWDAKWLALSVPARKCFLGSIKLPASDELGPGDTLPSIPSESLPRVGLEELKAAGFVAVDPLWGASKTPAIRVFVGDCLAFALRIRAATRYKLLGPHEQSQIRQYVDHCYFPYDLGQAVRNVLQSNGLGEYVRFNDILDQHVLTQHWPTWVLGALSDPVADAIWKEVAAVERPLLLTELIGRIKGPEPPKVRASLEKLIAYLVLFEDLDPTTLEVRVGMLPIVREKLAQAGQRRRRQLVLCEVPKDMGPDEGYQVADLRGFLLEVASAPPRLRQDMTLFQKELTRFLGVLESWPPWMSQFLKLTPEERLNQACHRARSLEHVEPLVSGKVIQLQLTHQGRSWLMGSIDDQHASVFATYLGPPVQANYYSPNQPAFVSAGYSYGYHSNGDQRFLGIPLVALPVTKGELPPQLWQVQSADVASLREVLDRIFSALVPGVFHTMESLIETAVCGEQNPIFLGRGSEPGRVAVYLNGYPVPPLLDRLEGAATSLLTEFIVRRLIPLGCLRLAVDSAGRICVARAPRLDAYFGRPVAAPVHAAASEAGSKVVVQPDFSVVIIGTHPAAAAELIPFCERTSPGSGRGALVLKITRPAVLQAIAQGLPPDDVLARLKRHASHDLPANVAREVEGWTAWVRQAALETLTVLRCPDGETADRIIGALRNQAERLNETLVAVTTHKLTTLERQKLQSQGVIVGSSSISMAQTAEPEPTPKARAKPKARKTRRRYY